MPSETFERARVVTAFITGQERDPGKLASMIFHARHPELGGRKIEKREKTLAAEWHAIKRDIVKPALDSMGFGGVDDSDLKRARWITNASAPGTKRTVSQLIETYRPSICPEVPLPILIAFIRYEAGGGLFDDATHGTASQDPPWSSPTFYELGLFQTPAGLHGTCTGPSATTCEHAPPGDNTNKKSTWHRLCKSIGADPDDWTNPVTQVRVGLMDLEQAAQITRKNYASMFPTRGTDWDLRAAVLLGFAGGVGFTSKQLYKHAKALKAMPENERWAYMRSHAVTKHEKKLYKNVDKKVALAWYLGYSPLQSPTPELEFDPFDEWALTVT